MPLYEYKCRKCHKIEDRVAHFDETVLSCPCGGTAERQFHGNFGINMGVGAYGYYDETLQTYVNSNKHKREVMREQGVSERFGKGWR